MASWKCPKFNETVNTSCVRGLNEKRLSPIHIVAMMVMNIVLDVEIDYTILETGLGAFGRFGGGGAHCENSEWLADDSFQLRRAH